MGEIIVVGPALLLALVVGALWAELGRRLNHAS